MSEREEKFERMMQAVLNSYNSTAEKMDKGRIKTYDDCNLDH